MDVKTAFLNGVLEEEIYMDQPEGFVVPGQEHKVCKLERTLYGLKQAPKQWHDKFDSLIISHGFRINESDKCVYYKFIDNICTTICLYVDDLLIFGSHIDAVNKVKNLLRQNFDMKDLRKADLMILMILVQTIMILVLNCLKILVKALDKLSMQVSLAVFSMPLIALNQILHMLLGFYVGLLTPLVRSIGLLLEGSCGI